MTRMPRPPGGLAVEELLVWHEMVLAPWWGRQQRREGQRAHNVREDRRRDHLRAQQAQWFGQWVAGLDRVALIASLAEVTLTELLRSWLLTPVDPHPAVIEALPPPRRR